jgi:WD40 repeat protein
VVNLSFDPSGRRLATAAGDHRVRVWILDNKQVEQTPAGPVGRVNDIRFDPGGKSLVAGDESGLVYVWDASSWTGRELIKLPAAVTCLRYDPTGAILAVGCRNGTVTTVDVASGRPRQTLGGDNGGVASVAFGPDGRLLAVASADRTIRVWDEAAGTLVHTLRGHVRAVTAVRFSPDGRRLFSGSQDQTVRVWHAESGQSPVVLHEPDEVTALAVDNDGQMLASAGPGGTIGVRHAGHWSWTIPRGSTSPRCCKTSFPSSHSPIRASSNRGLATPVVHPRGDESDPAVWLANLEAAAVPGPAWVMAEWREAAVDKTGGGTVTLCGGYSSAG